MKKIFLFIIVFVACLEGYQLITEETTVTSALAQLFFSDNLHEVRPGELFRSGEMRPAKMAQIVKEEGIKTVLDVRADPKNLPSDYVGEKDAILKVGATYESFPLLGSKEISRASLLNLLDLIDKAEPPLLVHCTSGTHRSGVVATIWMMERDKLPYEEAIKQLTPKYGYFYWERRLKGLVQGHPTIDNILWRYGEALKKERISFRQWVEQGMG